MNKFNTPILFLTFNRPDLTRAVFDEIKKVKPKQLFWVSDGARNERERKLVEETRKIINEIDWECDIKTNFSENNMGCKMRVSSAITWFFQNVSKGIILEDDCLPNPSFFDFCQDLLEKYENNDQVMHIGGTNFQNGIWRGDGSYYFSKYAHIWGWATWRRSWQKYDINLTHDKTIDTWDYQWENSIKKTGGICIIPNKNLVSNIGFREDGTHTKNINSPRAELKSEKLENLIHPTIIKIDTKADKYTHNKTEIRIKPIKMKIKKILKYISEMSLKSLYWSVIKPIHSIRSNKLKIVEINDGYAKGIKIVVAEKTPKIYQDMINGSYEKHIIETLLSKIDLQNKVIWDIGAHFGYMSMVFSRLVGNFGKIVSFEPNPDNIINFHKNMENNPELAEKIQLYQYAISSNVGTMPLQVSKIANTSKTSGGFLDNVAPPLDRKFYEDFKKIDVKVDTIDNILKTTKTPTPDLIKIDIEGGEWEAVKGGIETISSKKPVLLIEIHNVEMMFRIYEKLSELGYKIDLIDEKSDIQTRMILATQ